MYTCWGRGRVYLCGYLWRPEEGVRSLGAGVANRFWELNSDLGKELETLLISSFCGMPS